MTEDGHRTGWYFPPTAGGTEVGFHDAGIATFEGDRLGSLAREVIQNSLDARQDYPVTVSFEIRKGYLPGQGEFRQILEQCRDWGSDPEHVCFFQKALKTISEPSIDYFCIIDENTSGLDDKSWDALVRKSGVPHKTGHMPGGRFGIGKHAPFALDALRTVFYWSAFAREDGTIEERMQGKAILTSHEAPDGQMKQNVGFYGCISDRKCTSLRHQDIDSFFRRNRGNSRPAVGTALWIPGFRRSQNWTREIAVSVAANYFYAIHERWLNVFLEPEDENLPLEITAGTLDKIFALEEMCNSNSRQYYDALRNPQHEFTIDDPDLGQCRLYVNVQDGLPRRVAFIRGSGILITDRQKGLLRFPGCRDFAAVFVCDNKQGNDWLWRMENPQHDRFEPDRLSDADSRQKGQKILKRITRDIRDRIKEVTRLTVQGNTQKLTELAEFFPDPDTDHESLPGDQGPQKESPGADNYIELKPLEHKPHYSPAVVEPDDNGDFGIGDEDEEKSWQPGNGNPSANGGIVPGGGNGSRPVTRPYPIKNARVTRAGSDLTVAFTPQKAGCVTFHLEYAGDAQGGEVVALEGNNTLSQPSKSGERISVQVTPVNHDIASIRIKAYEKIPAKE